MKKEYSEEEIARIIRRAAQLESEQKKSNVSERPGLKIEELIEVASEAGLDPENVRIAVKELSEEKSPGPDEIDEGTTPKPSTVSHLTTERWIDGKLSDELADSVIADLRHRYDASDAERSWFKEWHDDEWDEQFGKGNVQKTGRSVEWKYVDKTGSLETRVLMQPRGRKIRIRVTKRNLWDPKTGDGPGGEAFEFMELIPMVAGFVLLFSLPYGFMINALIALVSYTGLELISRPMISKLREKWGERLLYRNKPRLENNREKYESEIESLADEICRQLEESLDSSMIGDARSIEIEPDEPGQEDQENQESRVENHLRSKER